MGSSDRSSVKTRWLASIAAVATGFACLVAIAPVEVPAAEAANPNAFDPGLIISDAVFYDGGAMGADEVQAFLRAQAPNCVSSYACLTTYRQDTPSMPASANRCAAYEGRAGERAADIIARVGAACGISQKVLIVLLQKEQGLVTHASPTKTRFDRATGMACPDTAPCDPAFSGFFYQVYYAARQYRTYLANPTGFNYRAGRVNSILYHPNAACGRGDVFIVNNATAGLYNYTPYQPNAASLANLYGTGDGCSSYGNRNFWRLFSDWFGSPTVGSSLIKTATSPNIYLISGTERHLIRDSATLQAYAPLGAVAVVSPSVVDSYTEGAPASRIIRSSSGGIYFHDAGIRLLFSSCDLVVDYGGSCEPSGYTQLTDFQINRFVAGPPLGSVLRTTAGGRYLLEDGTRREIVDEQSQTEAGFPASNQILTEAAVASLPVGDPLVRDGVFVRDRNNGALWYFGGGVRSAVSAATASATGASTRVAGAIFTSSIARVPSSSAEFTGVIDDGGVLTMLTPAGRRAWEGPPVTIPTATLTPGIAAAYPPAAPIRLGDFVKASSAAAVYRVGNTGLRSIVSWDAYVALSGASDAAGIVSLADAAVRAVPVGARLLTPGTLVKSTTSSAVFLIDGDGTRIFVNDFAVPAAAGISGLSTVAVDDLGSYSRVEPALGYVLRCAGTTSISAGGRLHPLTDALLAEYALTARDLDVATCRRLVTGTPATRFIRVPSGAIYLVEDGQRRSIPSMARYQELGGPAIGYLDVDAGFAATIPPGPRA